MEQLLSKNAKKNITKRTYPHMEHIIIDDSPAKGTLEFSITISAAF